MGFAVFAEDFWQFGAAVPWEDLVRRLHAAYGSEYLPQSEHRWRSIRRRLEDRSGYVAREAFLDFCSGPVGVAVLEAFATAPGEELGAQDAAPAEGLAAERRADPARAFGGETDEPPPAFGWPGQDIAAEEPRHRSSHDGDVTFRSPVSEVGERNPPASRIPRKTSVSAASLDEDPDYLRPADERARNAHVSDSSESEWPSAANPRARNTRASASPVRRSSVLTQKGERFNAERLPLLLVPRSNGSTLHLSWPRNIWPAEDSAARLLLYRCSCDPATGQRYQDSLVEVEIPPRATSFEDKSVEAQTLYGYLLLCIRHGQRFAVTRTVFAHL
jgi:hypothetical protein